MTYSFGSGSYVISLCLLVLFFMQHGDCSGKLEIHLKTYRILNGVLDSNGQCCDGTIATTSLCEPCDPFIVACLLDARDHGHGSCVSANLSTVPVNNTNDIDFEATPGLVANYFTLNFTIPSQHDILYSYFKSARSIVKTITRGAMDDLMHIARGQRLSAIVHQVVHGTESKVILWFSMYDDDTYDVPPSEPDLLENNSYTIFTLVPHNFTEAPIYTNGTVPTNKTSLEFDYFLQCDQDFYGFCDKYCHPDPDKYSCDSSGSRVCKPLSGWIGTNCTTFDYCINQTCQNGGSCSNGLNSFTCKCTKNFTGIWCENNATSGSLTTQSSTLPINLSSSSSTTQTSTTTPKTGPTTTSSKLPPNSTRSPQKTELSQSKEEEKGDNTGAIVGAVIGTLVALGLVAAGVAYYMKRQKNKIHTRSELQPDNETKTDPGADEARIEHEPDNKATDQTKIKPDNVDSQQNGQLSQLQNEIEINNPNVTKD